MKLWPFNIRRKTRSVPGPWTVLLVTDVDTQYDHGHAVVTDTGHNQIAHLVGHIRALTTEAPEVWLGTTYDMHRATAKELADQLNGWSAPRDFSKAGYADFRDVTNERFTLPLADHPADRPIVFVTLYRHAQNILGAAGVHTLSDRAMRSSRAYAVNVDHRGKVTRSPLLDDFDVAELMTYDPEPDANTID